MGEYGIERRRSEKGGGVDRWYCVGLGIGEKL